MAIYLSGGGSGKDSRELDEAFLEDIEKIKPLLYIPLARDLPYDSCLDWIKSNFEFGEFKNFKMINNKDELLNIDLKNYSGVYIGGGNTYKLLKELKEVGFLDILSKYIREEGIVYGGSAGAIILGKDILTANDPNEVNINNFEGLNELNEFSVFCHYNSEVKKDVEAYTKKTKNSVLVLSEKTGLIVQGEEVFVVGQEPLIIADREASKIVPSNSKITLA
jgi:dipeptidase E